MVRRCVTAAAGLSPLRGVASARDRNRADAILSAERMQTKFGRSQSERSV